MTSAAIFAPFASRFASLHIAGSVAALMFCTIFIICTTSAHMRACAFVQPIGVNSRARIPTNVMQMMKMKQKAFAPWLSALSTGANADANDANGRSRLLTFRHLGVLPIRGLAWL